MNSDAGPSLRFEKSGATTSEVFGKCFEDNSFIEQIPQENSPLGPLPPPMMALFR